MRWSLWKSWVSHPYPLIYSSCPSSPWLPCESLVGLLGGEDGHYAIRAARRGHSYMEGWVHNFIKAHIDGNAEFVKAQNEGHQSLQEETASMRRMTLLTLKVGLSPGIDLSKLSDEEALEFLRGITEQDEVIMGKKLCRGGG